MRTCLRGILNAFREWEIASTNTIKGIEDGLMQNERAEKERKKMKRHDNEKSWENLFLSLIIAYNNAYIDVLNKYSCFHSSQGQKVLNISKSLIETQKATIISILLRDKRQ